MTPFHAAIAGAFTTGAVLGMWWWAALTIRTINKTDEDREG